jgi:hypothetical protein
MKKQILTSAVSALILGTLLSACNPQQNPPRGLSSDWNLRNSKVSVHQGTNDSLALEQIAIQGQRFYTAKNANATTNELPFMLYDASRTDIIINRTKREVILDSPFVYTFSPAKTLRGTIAKQIEIKPEFLNGTRTSRNRYSLGAVDSDIQTDIIRQSDLDYKLKTLDIGTETFFPIGKNQSELRANTLSFYLIPKSNTSERITPEGKLILRNEQRGIYEATKVYTQDYHSRTNPPSTNVQTRIPTSSGIQ